VILIIKHEHPGFAVQQLFETLDVVKGNRFAEASSNQSRTSLEALITCSKRGGKQQRLETEHVCPIVAICDCPDSRRKL
jgi:putative hemolysin